MEIKTFTRQGTEFEIGSFDFGKEIEFCISTEDRQILSMWLTPSQTNELINYLAQRLRVINEPIELLSDKELS